MRTGPSRFPRARDRAARSMMGRTLHADHAHQPARPRAGTQPPKNQIRKPSPLTTRIRRRSPQVTPPSSTPGPRPRPPWARPSAPGPPRSTRTRASPPGLAACCGTRRTSLSRSRRALSCFALELCSLPAVCARPGWHPVLRCCAGHCRVWSVSAGNRPVHSPNPASLSMNNRTPLTLPLSARCAASRPGARVSPRDREGRPVPPQDDEGG